MKLFKKKTAWIPFCIKAALILALLSGGLTFLKSHYRIGIDPQIEKCLPRYFVFLIDLKYKKLTRDNVYAFLFKGRRMVKILVGMPHDTVEIDQAQQIKVNGTVIRKGLYLAHQLGHPASHFYGKTVLKEGQYWFIGKSFHSFDSRYWGAVQNDQIIGRTYPLF